MERANFQTATENIQQNEQTQTLSQNQSNSTAISQINRDEHVLMFQLINKCRMLNGWTTKTAQELDATIRTWFEMFAVYKIPASAWLPLYFRAFDLRQIKQRQGEDVPQCDATLLVSCWTGQHGLQRELEQKRIEERRYLPDTAKSQCPKCFGTGWEERKDEHGYKKSFRCPH